MSSQDWQPNANTGMLRLRGAINRAVRDFFHQREVLEVETPLLAQHPVSDPYIECLSCLHQGQPYYLQSSPEYAMKRMLAAGCGDIYSLAKVFRAGESGRRHNVEFTMLEWYRKGFDDRQLMAELENLIQELVPIFSGYDGRVLGESTTEACSTLPVRYKSYGDLFNEHLAINPHEASLADLQDCIDQHLDMGDYRCEDISTALDVLISQYIEPLLPGLVFIYDYPACQAALARVMPDEQGQLVAKRFEVFIDGMELANGYWELQDAKEQRARFLADNQQRRNSALPEVSIDERLLAAMESGLPDCAGVALGMDRLLLQLSEAEHISEVLSFAWPRA
ncbi:EF-P lysine aminoacylase EpmA [Pseudoteredinibacter isoporae]|uniref:Lysyl-tRNA synthetase class 2 n=1 Tax=Pseudoteredinibacter isoporae TaxID=570281 RepID=A0A7X0JTG2_9GAMM|nr:EF-P lysine aminoacylase EpmA [Pseudoteredinibacter isoporae]MBB6521081.1 lysyl-tRNA synthetase class 2 [Pseudoteredinibacter isoporae]NHO86645.1 EF-P lysine aminoacylase GenX [Pseudoteredinibacter isoporae]NIB24903.1 EF-P lysine aminoacylase GenX [Pseudoteredinibacter isoporae]